MTRTDLRSRLADLAGGALERAALDILTDLAISSSGESNLGAVAAWVDALSEGEWLTLLEQATHEFAAVDV